MKYNPALDGLRAVAILLVLIDHAWGFVGGLIGVDVFFVLSGYLITSILLVELRQTGAINYRDFYARRFLRLAPAFLLLVAFQLIHAAFSPQASEILTATWLSLAQVQNLNMAFEWGPIDAISHTWSLSTEEQFYFLWPLALPLVLSKRPLAWLGAAVALMVAARFFPMGYKPANLEFNPALRPVGLLIGCALAFMPKVELRCPVWLPLGALVVLAAVEESCVLAAPLLASLATATIIVTARGGFLAWSPLRYVGKISYGLYLYHYPILTLGHKWLHGIVGTTALLALAFIAAALSYEFVETPILKLRRRRPMRLAATAAA